MAGKEQPSMNFGEKTGDFVLRTGVVIGIIGALGIIAGMSIGGPIFVAGAEAGAVGFVGKKLSKGSEKKS